MLLRKKISIFVLYSLAGLILIFFIYIIASIAINAAVFYKYKNLCRNWDIVSVDNKRAWNKVRSDYRRGVNTNLHLVPSERSVERKSNGGKIIFVREIVKIDTETVFHINNVIFSPNFINIENNVSPIEYNCFLHRKTEYREILLGW